jgi:threonine/homoserine efflux transporter RhtA
MTKVQSTINLVLKAVAIGMAIPSIILLVLDVASLETNVMLLSIGLLALAVASLSETE